MRCLIFFVTTIFFAGCTPPDLPLIQGTREENLQLVKSLLADQGGQTDINKSDLLGNTALHAAAYTANLELINIVLKAGADINAVNEQLKTPLMYTVENNENYLKAFNLLLANGADLKVKDKDDNTMLHLAMVGGNTEIIKTLINAGVDPFQENRFHEIPYKLAIQNQIDISIVLMILNTVKNPLRKEKFLSEVFMYTCSVGDSVLLDSLMDYVPQWKDLRDISGCSPLHRVCTEGKTGCINLILNKGVDVNYIDKDKENALFVACRNGRVNAVELLLRNGCSPYQKNSYEEFAFELLFDKTKVASPSDTQKLILDLFFDHGFQIPETELENSAKASLYFLAGAHASKKADKEKASEYFEIASRNYLKEINWAEDTADSLEKKMRTDKVFDFLFDVTMPVIASFGTSANRYLALKEGESTYTAYYWIPGKGDYSNVKKYIGAMRQYASECREMLNKCK